jgi:DNA topoisomerase-3
VILQQPIDHTQIQKLLTTGKTDLLEKFVSAKSGRPFKAYLVVDDTGKTGFEFPPRDGEEPEPPPAPKRGKLAPAK